MTKSRRLVLLALMVSQALVLSIVEAWIPIPGALPGVKLGLANIITLIVIMFFGYKDAILVVIVRCILASIFTGGIITFLFSFAGGILSLLVMVFLYKKLSRIFSTVGISIAGAVAHNAGQMIAASFIMKELAVMAYLPVLLISAVITGVFVGLCADFFVENLKAAWHIIKLVVKVYSFYSRLLDF